MKVLKFGGTSVGTAARMKKIVNLLPREGRHWLVLSAISGTTDLLLETEKYWKEGNLRRSLDMINDLGKKLEAFVFELFGDPDAYRAGDDFIRQKMESVREILQKTYDPFLGRKLVAEGELISSGLMFRYMRSLHLPVSFICAPELISKRDDGSVDIERLARQSELVMTLHPESRIFITQGFICRDALGRMDNLGRGGSDYTATLIGNAVDAEEIQIWTDVDGMHNNDPRVISETKPVTELSFDEADELAYFGAKVLYPRCVFPAKQKNIPIRIKSTMNPDAPGTVIRNEVSRSNIKAVAAKDGITAVRIRSGRMLMAYGFLKKVFEIFEKFETPIDMITTSEVSVSLTIDNDRHLAAIVRELETLGDVEVENEQAIVCVVGDFMTERRGVIRHVMDALKEIPVRMVSYGGSMNNVSVLVAAADKKNALESLHRYFFLNPKIHVY